MPEIRFSIVIVHRNGAPMLLNALASLMRAVGSEDEIILVDNCSTDASVKQVRATYPAVRIVENGCNNGFARACNQGLAAARGDYVLFLNNDAFLPPDALDRFAEDFVAFPKAALIGGQLVGDDEVPQRSAMDYVPQEVHDTVAQYLENFRSVREILDQICSINRELLRRREPL